MSEELKSVLVLGGTGATGKEVVKLLMENQQVAKVKMISRRNVDFPDDCPGSNKVEQVIVDFDNLDASKDEFANQDAAFCCLGEFDYNHNHFVSVLHRNAHFSNIFQVQQEDNQVKMALSKWTMTM